MEQVSARFGRLRPVPIAVLALAIGFGMFGIPIHRVPAQAQPVDRATIVQSFYAALAQGDLDAAVASFSEDALYVGGRFCAPPNTCVGRTAIRTGLSSIAGFHPSYTFSSLIVTGSVVFGEAIFRDDTTRATGLDRVLLPFMAEVPAGRITAFVAALDTTDAQTAQYLGVPQSPALDRQAILDQWFLDRSNGNVDGALGALSDDIFYVSNAPCTQERPCIGKDAVRGRLLVPAEDLNRSYTLFGSAVVVQYEQHGAALAAAGVDRILVTTIVQMPQDKIALFVREPDLTDPVTADNVGFAQAPPN